MKALDLMWVAGLLEGEGCFYVQKSHATHPTKARPRIQIQMTDEDVIARAARILECGYNRSLPPSRRKPTYVIAVTGAKATALMRQLLPHMGERRSAKIREILEVSP